MNLAERMISITYIVIDDITLGSQTFEYLEIEKAILIDLINQKGEDGRSVLDMWEDYQCRWRISHIDTELEKRRKLML